MEMEDIKIYLAIISTAIAIFAATLYIKDISQHKTKPHIYSWFVSFCTIFIAATIQFTNGSWHQSLSLSVTFLLNTIILLLAFKFGTKNINNFDKSYLCFLRLYL